MTECLPKVQILFLINMRKKSAGKLYLEGWIKLIKNGEKLFTYGMQCINKKKIP